MESVDVKRVPQGYMVSCLVRNLPAAMKAVDVLLEVSEAAFEAEADYLHLRPGCDAYDAHPLNLPRADEGS